MFCAAGSEATELRLRAQRAVADAFGSGLDHGPPGSWPEVLEVTKRFAEVWGREVRLTGGSPGVRRVVDRLAEGYTVAELCRAIVGSRNDPFFQANGHYQTLHTILRDSGQVDRFMVIADEPPARGSGGKPIQPNHSGINVQKNVVIVEG